MVRIVLIVLVWAAIPVVLFGQKGLVVDWTFHPGYTLKGNASNYPGNRIAPPVSRFQRFKTLGAPLIFNGESPSQRLTDLLEPENIPSKSFTVEMWLLNHVNMPVGVMLTAKGKQVNDKPAWVVGCQGKEVAFQLRTEKGTQTLAAEVEQGWKKYWGHLVVSYNGKEAMMYLNGQLIASEKAVGGNLLFPADYQLEVAGYFNKEPYMEVSNLLKSARLYDRALSEKEIESRFQALQTQVEKGVFFNKLFHFNAGPYLHLSTQNSINILWETDRLATATVRYGHTLPLDKEIQLTEASYIQEVVLKDLEAETPYYYEVVAKSVDGTEMSSGILTFGTAVQDDSPFTFCVLGDTESRPHINHRLGELIWEERPHFMLHLGDVTDGGKEAHKFEWNYEYFTGITPVASRIPMFPVPGNGESDLYWYKRYHKLPQDESYYSFKYGNAEFFMLNSNAAEELNKGGRQYEWLQKALAASSAEWKFVAHHHCPVSSDENDFGNTWEGVASTKGDPRFDDLKALYESAGVDVVFYGHVHAYERSWPLKEGQVDQKNGVTYIQSGGGGGNLEDFTPTHNTFSNRALRGHHYCRVDVYANTFYFKMYDINGVLKDFVELKKKKPSDLK